MPIYEYVCERCGRLAEVMQKVSDPAPATCPECGQGPMARLVSRTSFQLKGGGWYADLYASKKEKPAPPATPAAGAPASAPEKPATATAAPATPAAPASPASKASPAGGASGGSGGAAPGGGAPTGGDR